MAAALGPRRAPRRDETRRDEHHAGRRCSGCRSLPFGQIRFASARGDFGPWLARALDSPRTARRTGHDGPRGDTKRATTDLDAIGAKWRSSASWRWPRAPLQVQAGRDLQALLAVATEADLEDTCKVSHSSSSGGSTAGGHLRRTSTRSYGKANNEYRSPRDAIRCHSSRA